MLHDFVQSEELEAVIAEYGRAREEADRRHRAAIAHDLRNLVHTALLSFKVLEARGGVSGGTAGALLGRSLAAIRDLADRLAAPAAASPGGVASSCDVHRRESAPGP